MWTFSVRPAAVSEIAIRLVPQQVPEGKTWSTEQFQQSEILMLVLLPEVLLRSTPTASTRVPHPRAPAPSPVMSMSGTPPTECSIWPAWMMTPDLHPVPVDPTTDCTQIARAVIPPPPAAFSQLSSI